MQKQALKTLHLILLTTSLLISCSGQVVSPQSSSTTRVGGAGDFFPRVLLDSEPEQANLPTTRISYSIPPKNIRFLNLSNQEGLSQNVVKCILQDSQGFMWFSTEDGLNRYDGYSFLVFRPDPDNFYSINDIYINVLFEDSRGIIWIGTRQGGLNRYDPTTGQFTHFLNNPLVQSSLSSNIVNAIQEDDNGKLWIGTDHGLDRFDPDTGTFKHYYINPAGVDAPLDDTITTIFKASNGILWIGTTENGLKRFHPITGSYRVYTHDPGNSNSISDNHVNTIEEDRNGSLWIGTNSGLNLLDWETELFFRYLNSPSPDSLSSNSIFSLTIDNGGNLWVGTSSGLDFLVRRTRTFMHYRHDPGSQTSLSNDTVLSIYEDQGGILWVGTYGGGLSLYDPVQNMFQYYYHSNTPGSLSGNIIFPIHAAQDGNVWIGTHGDGLNLFDPVSGSFTIFKNDAENPGSLQNNYIWALLIDHAGSLWVGTSTGLDRLDMDTGIFHHYVNIAGDLSSLSRGEVHAIYEDSRRNIWVGTQFGLNLYHPVDGTFTHYSHIPGDPTSISDDDITAFMEDDAGRLWIGTSRGGLNRLDRGTGQFTSYTHDPQDRISIGNNSIMCIYQDQKGRIWVGTAGGGLSRYDPVTDSFDNFTTNDGLPNNVVYGILEDPRGSLWMSTNYGLSNLDPETMSFHNFTASDGLQSNQFNMNAFALSPTGEMYFGGTNGLTAFTPTEPKPNDYVPQVVLLSFIQGGNSFETEVPIEQLDNITIRWPDNSFEFSYTALGYSQSAESRYAYMLENFDEDWFYAGNERNGRYTNLQGGDYILRVKASNSDGIWNEEGIAVKITVIPPFWATKLFQILVLLSLFGLAVGIYQVRLKNVQARSHELERLVRIRTTALEKRGQELEALYSADGRMLRTQTLDQVYQTLVNVAEEMLHADKSAVLSWDEKHRQLVVRVSRGFDPISVQKLIFSGGDGILGAAVESGQPVIISNVTSDPRFNDLPSPLRTAIHAENIFSFLHLPIVIESQTVGFFIVGFTHLEAFNEDTVRLFSALVQRAALSVENAMLFEQTKELAIVEERNRLARDLHDSAKQKAFAAMAQLGAATGMLRSDRKVIRNHLEEAENLVYEVIQELTFLIQEIHPSALKEKGLAAMLREYVFQWENRNDARVNLHIENDRRLPLNIEQALYRIIQEALANITRHSKAAHVKITLLFHDAQIEAEVADDGCGFDCDERPAGLGLRSIRERIESIHGRCDIISRPGEGTRIHISAPIENLD